MAKLKNDQSTNIPIYSFEKHDRVGSTKIEAKQVVIFEGLFTFIVLGYIWG